MKKVLSLVMVLAMLFTSTVVFADTEVTNPEGQTVEVTATGSVSQQTVSVMVPTAVTFSVKQLTGVFISPVITVTNMGNVDVQVDFNGFKADVANPIKVINQQIDTYWENADQATTMSTIALGLREWDTLTNAFVPASIPIMSNEELAYGVKVDSFPVIPPLMTQSYKVVGRTGLNWDIGNMPVMDYSLSLTIVPQLFN